MDLNDEYLKMILALPDQFFEGWEFNDGDPVYLIEEIDDYSPSKDHGLYTVFDGLLANDGFLNTENWLYVSVVDFKNGRPIPSQEQLQQIMDMSPIEFIEDFYEYAHDPLHEDMDASIFYIDLNCFTLAYVMDRKYKKYWDGESWI